MTHIDTAADLIGHDPAFLNVLDAARVVAVTDVSVLVLGESGSGKELLARYLHQHSRRAHAPFVAINCAAIPEALAESELFGHAKGAYTGADKSNPGRIRAADGGTLFLDEIGELPLALQAKLLRFLESGECQALGEHVPHKVNVRVIAATNRELYSMVQQQRFRADLYYRLYVVPLHLPALRERSCDVPALARHLLHVTATHYGLAAPRLTACALRALQAYAWPGNVRELRNVCERLVVFAHGQEVTVDRLPLEVRAPTHTPQTTVGLNLTDTEKQLILQALERTGGNRSRAARLLGITRDTLLYRLKKYALVNA